MGIKNLSLGMCLPLLGDVFSAFAAGHFPSFLKPGYGHSVRNGGKSPGETR